MALDSKIWPWNIFFGSNLGNEIRVILRGKGNHNPYLVSGIVRIHCLIILHRPDGYYIVGDTQRLLCCVAFFSELGIVTTGQELKYQ